MSDEPSQSPPEPHGTSSVDPESIEGVFITALAKSDPTERERFLSEACEGDAEKRQRVDVLLRAYDDAGSFFEKPPLAGATIVQTLSFEFLEPSDDPSLLGKLGPYEIYEMIGRGGMGIVFRARDPKLNRVVAVKVLAPELAVNPNAKRRFVREAQSGAVISHPHVVTIHAVDDEEKLPFLVMECIVGQSLQQKIDKVGSLRLIEVLRISKQIAEGLAAAHHQGLIHRDIKPANILLENGVERVKITDFGLARAIDDVSVTRTGEVAGSPQFMSPEQALGERVDQRSDLFSLGCVMYAMCAGRSPFRATSIAAAIRRVCDDEPRPLVEINPEVPEWMIAIIGKLLQKNPSERYQSADELVHVFETHLASISNGQAQSESATTANIEPSGRALQQSSANHDANPLILDALSSSFLRLALLGPLITLLGCFLWAMFPQEINSRLVPYFIGSIGPVLWGAVLIGWLGSHVNRVEWGSEASFKGRVASVLALVTPPLWILGVPTGLMSWWVLRQESVRESFQSRESQPATSLALPGYLLGLGVFLGASLTSVVVLFFIEDHLMDFTDVAETLPAVLILGLLVLPLRGPLYRGRFWTDLAIVLSAFSIVFTLFLMFSPHLPPIGIHHPVEVAIAMFFFGITLGLPCVAIWKLIAKPWLTQPETANEQNQRNRLRNARTFAGLSLLLAVAIFQALSGMLRTPDPVMTPSSDVPREVGQKTVRQNQTEPLLTGHSNSEIIRSNTLGSIDVKQLVGSWVVKGKGKTAALERIVIEPVDSDHVSDTEIYDTGLQLTFTDVGGNPQTGILSINQAARSVSKQCSLRVLTKEGVLYRWFGGIELSRYQDHLRLSFFQVSIGEGDQPPDDFNRISQRDSAPRTMDAWYQREKTDPIGDEGGALTESP